MDTSSLPLAFGPPLTFRHQLPSSSLAMSLSNINRFSCHNFQTVDEKFIEKEKKFRAVEKTVKTLLKNVSTYLEEFQVRK